jgi:hypothetical protein
VEEWRSGGVEEWRSGGVHLGLSLEESGEGSHLGFFRDWFCTHLSERGDVLIHVLIYHPVSLPRLSRY